MEHSLDALLSDPTLTATLSRQSALDLLTKTAALSAVLTARVLAEFGFTVDNVVARATALLAGGS